MRAQPERAGAGQAGGGQPAVAGAPPRRLASVGGFLLPLAGIALLGWGWAVRARPWGWRGGEYASAFAGLVLGGLVVGALLLGVPRHRALRSFGRGLLLGASLGVLLGVGLIALLGYGLSRTEIPF